MPPPMAFSLMLAAAVVFRRYTLMPLSSYDALLSAVDTDCCPLCQAAVAFVVPLPSPVVAVRCCRRRSTLPSLKDAAVVVGRYYRMPSSAATVGCCGQGWLGRTVPEVHWCQRSPDIARPIQRLRPPVLRHQTEAQITICAKPGAHREHTGRTLGAHLAYARRKKKN